MARVPSLSRIAREDFQEAPDWFGRFLDLLSPFVGDVSGALGGQLDGANLRKQFEPLSLTTSAVLEATFAGGRVTFKNRLGVSPRKVILARCIPAEMHASFAGASPIGLPIWDLNSAGLIRIRHIAGLAPSTKYELTFEVE